jgi:hypothetical protein
MDGEVVGIVTAILNPTRRNIHRHRLCSHYRSAGGAVGIPPF